MADVDRDPAAGQRHLLRTLLATYFGRVSDSLSPLRANNDDATLDAVHLAWAGPVAPASRTTTGCRARGCSSSTTTSSGAPTTRIRYGATRSPTSATTSSRRTGRRTTADRAEPARGPHGLGLALGQFFRGPAGGGARAVRDAQLHHHLRSTGQGQAVPDQGAD